MGQEKILAIETTVTYASASKTVYVPAGSKIVDISVVVTENFDDTGTDVLNIGITGTANYFVSALDIAAAGKKAPTVLKAGLVNSASAPTAVICAYTGQNGNATQGIAVVTLIVAQI